MFSVWVRVRVSVLQWDLNVPNGCKFTYHMISPISPQCILGLFQSFSFYFDSWYQRSTESTPSLKDVDAKEKLREFYAFATNAVRTVNKSIR